MRGRKMRALRVTKDLQVGSCLIHQDELPRVEIACRRPKEKREREREGGKTIPLLVGHRDKIRC
jgi:hypothetical protein